MTAEDAFNYCMNAYPTLYAATDVKTARSKVFGQIFNTIGNGYDNYNDFFSEFERTPERVDMTKAFPAKYIGVEPLYTGYTDVQSKSTFSAMSYLDSALLGLYTEIEKDSYPNVTKWTQANRIGMISTPYPNFYTRYSLLHLIELEKLDDSWLQAGISYYVGCREFFNGPDAVHYHSAWPADPKKQVQLILDYETSIARCIKGIDSQNEQWAAVSKAYEVAYKGDTALFIQERWKKENTRIGAFIEKTLMMLQENLDKRATFNTPGM